MEYTVNKLALLSGVSSRTLRYYDQIGLLSPCRITSNGYRIYGQREVDTLQQILFYRELGVSLDEIKELLNAVDYERVKALEEHLAALLQRKSQLEDLINNVNKTIKSAKGEIKMSDKEKFEGFKKKLIQDNEDKYGKEVREKYGEKTVEASNAKLLGMSEEQFTLANALREELESLLVKAFKEGDPTGSDAQRVCDLHRQWLCMFWSDGTYSKEAHKALGEGYVSDERFTAYYDKLAVGCAVFLRDALNIYCAE